MLDWYFWTLFDGVPESRQLDLLWLVTERKPTENNLV